MLVASNVNISVANLAANSSEVIIGATVTQMMSATDGGPGMKYYRANTSDANNLCWSFAGSDNGYYDFAGNGLQVDSSLSSANIIFVVGGANTTSIVEFHKISPTPNTSY